MVREENQQALVFGDLADDYSAGRPGYPAELFAEIVRRAPGPDPNLLLAIDIAAGAGAATVGLAERFGDVIAVDPSPSMLRRAVSRLADNPGRGTAVGGLAEALPIRSGIADVLTVAQAFHWMDARPALDEFARILRPSGLLAVLWNIPRDNPFNADVWALVEKVNPGHKRPVTMNMREVPPAIRDDPRLDVESSFELEWSRDLTPDRYVRYAFSWSYIGGALERHERGPFEADLREIVETHFGAGPVVDDFLTVAHFGQIA